MDDIQKLAGALFEQVEGYVGKMLAPIRAKLAEIEARQPEKGEPGQSVTLQDVQPVIIQAVKAEVASLPPAPAGKDGDHGKSITVADVAPLIADEVAKQVSAIPVPKNGNPGKDGAGVAGGIIDRAGDLILTLSNGETKNLGRVVGKDGEPGQPVDPASVAALVREYVSKAVEPLKAAGPGVDPVALQSMVDKAAADAMALLPPPAPGAPGRDADPEIIAKMVADAVAALPKPEDGKSVSVEDVTPVLADLVAKAVSALPPAPAGKDADMAEISRRIDEGIAKAVAGIRVPEDGKSVDLAEVDRMVSERVERAITALPKPPAGRDGLDAVEFLRNAAGNLVVTMSDGTVKDLGSINGAPGLGFDDLQAELDGDRRLTLQFIRGEQVKEFAFTLPIIIDRGVYSPGKAYERGDAVSFGGALWISQKDTDAKPGSNADWRLAVKKGRDGRDGRQQARPAGDA